ncbi:PREDICTED: coiled-coil-helix-coiled-coil-helix domain-containing protein 7 isoform X1 [Bison bison bison]|nr:PREDICTED: coiled-coil-helix-coiled-coil-helix domain-containing protein 7 isoform X1 [Bison bison bison]
MVIKSRTLSRKGGNLSSVCVRSLLRLHPRSVNSGAELCAQNTGHMQTRKPEKTLRMPMVTRRLRDPDVNPCLSESDASTRCMAENNYDKESCSSHFLKYKNCRKFWNSVMIQRRQNGVKPPMPTAAERDEILGGLGKMPY